MTDSDERIGFRRIIIEEKEKEKEEREMDDAECVSDFRIPEGVFMVRTAITRMTQMMPQEQIRRRYRKE